MRIVKVPGINGFGKTKGCRNAGNALITELKNLWSNEKGKKIEKERLDIEEIHVDNENLEEQENLIYENSKEELERQEEVIFLGGDHSISFPIGKAFLEFCREEKEEPCLIVFDAHPDCMIKGKNPSHEEWLRALIEEGFPEKNVLLVGARNIDEEEERFLREKKIKRISVNEINLGLEEITDVITEFSQGRALYVSFDIDVVDPAFAHSTGYLEPGGLTSRQAVYILSRLSLVKNLKIVDIVEISLSSKEILGKEEEKDQKKENLTVKLGAKILGEFL